MQAAEKVRMRIVVSPVWGCIPLREGDTLTRTFISLDQDIVQQQLLADIIEQGRQLLPDVHWVHPSSIHLTLAFLGELDTHQLNQATDATRDAALKTSAFSYRLADPGTFGELHRPRVLWMGVSEQSGSLNKVHRTLKVALEQHDFLTEKRPFAPHLTLARIDRPLTPDELERLQQFQNNYRSLSSEYYVSHLCVMKSELFPDGARYTCLNSCPFQP